MTAVIFLFYFSRETIHMGQVSKTCIKPNLKENMLVYVLSYIQICLLEIVLSFGNLDTRQLKCNFRVLAHTTIYNIRTKPMVVVKQLKELAG